MFRAKPAAEPTVIGQGTTIEGNLRASGRVQIDGHLKGTLEVDGQVSVGPKGSITGELIADELAIGGRVEGKVTARKHLYVAATGAVIGELCYGTLQVERGAVIDGRALHGEGEVLDVTDDAKISLRAHASTPLAAS
jgi:cytoskeletal protein CcmA (bactofilin family)